jgi:hypothetical protein
MKKYYGTAVFMGFTIIFVLLFSYLTPESKTPTEGIPHNYWIPNSDTIDFDTTGMQREADSVDAYMKYWYEVLDTNSDGDIDDIEINKQTPDWTGTTQGEFDSLFEIELENNN